MIISKDIYPIVEMLCEGYNEVEIAEILGVLPGVIRTKLNKWQKKNNMTIIPLIAAYVKERMKNYYENRAEYSALYKVKLGDEDYGEKI